MTFVSHKSIIVLRYKNKGVLKLSSHKKMGRPTDNPKRFEVKARVDGETFKILDDYCKQNSKNKSEGVRDGIHRLKKPQDK